MTFTDLSFAIFLIILFSLYWLIGAISRDGSKTCVPIQNILLLSASYVFYCWWDWRFILLILLTSLSTFIAGLAAQTRHAKLIAGANIILNLLILIAFKYLNFFGENLFRLFRLFGWGLDWPTVCILLPIGISFYTFQAISYNVDCVRGKIAPCRNPLDFFCYIAFFPQLVAGPIERAENLLPQIRSRRRFIREEASEGMRMILYGLFKKLCIADMIAPIVDSIYDRGDFSPLGIMKICILFSLQIYCDFSAYSEIARGVARLFGIRLMTNFRFPFFSRNFIEIWRRWHISLMEWFRDYVFIPLGGSRKGRMRTIINILIVFTLSGLWHGAVRNFVVWGLYCGVVSVVSRFIFLQRDPKSPVGISDMPQILITWLLFGFGFFLFRSHYWWQMGIGTLNVRLFAGIILSLSLFFKLCNHIGRQYSAKAAKAMRITVAMAGALAWGFIQIRGACESNPWDMMGWWWVIALVIAAIIEWKNRNADYALQLLPRASSARYGLYLLLFFFILIADRADTPFLYFRF